MQKVQSIFFPFITSRSIALTTMTPCPAQSYCPSKIPSLACWQHYHHKRDSKQDRNTKPQTTLKMTTLNFTISRMNIQHHIATCDYIICLLGFYPPIAYQCYLWLTFHILRKPKLAHTRHSRLGIRLDKVNWRPPQLLAVNVVVLLL